MKNEELGCAVEPNGNSSFFILNSSFLLIIGELHTMPSLASKLSSLTSQPSTNGTMGNPKCLAKA